MKAEPFLVSHSCSGILSLGMGCCEQVSQSSRCVHRYVSSRRYNLLASFAAAGA
jgi:hypothetical protein